jgi:hypothetical protein
LSHSSAQVKFLDSDEFIRIWYFKKINKKVLMAFKEESKMKKNIIVATLATAMLFAGCSKKSADSGAGSTDTSTLANIYGAVSTSNTSNQKMTRKLSTRGFQKAGDVYAMSVAGCTITAEDLTTGAAVATATSDANGKYTLTGVTDGATYKVIADCGGTGKFSLISTADTIAATAKTPVATNPLSTLIAAQVVKSIFAALDSQLGALPAALMANLKATILEKIVPVIVALITSEIEEAVASGAMEAPTAEEATALTTSVDTATTDDSASLDAAIDTYEVAKPMPPAIDQAITGSLANSEVAVNCNSTNTAASALTCTKALTKLLYSALGFGVIVKTDGTGAFGTTTCDATGIGAQLPNGTYTDLHDKEPSISAGILCYVTSNISRPDRNQESQDGDHGGGPDFAESANFDGAAGDEIGYLTVFGQAMYGGYKYNLSDINKFIFGRDAGSGAGMDARLVAMTRGWDDSTHQPKVINHYKNSTGVWTVVDTTGFDQSFNWGLWAIGGCVADGWAFNSSGNLKHTQSTVSCTASAGYEALVLGIGAGDFTTDPILGKKYYGPVPNQDQLDDYFDNGKMHLDHNPTGQKEFHVLFSAFPVWEKIGTDGNMIRPCDDNDSSTVCGDASGNSLEVRVNIALGSPDAAGRRAITSITKATSGEFYMQPVWDQSGFTGVFQFIRAADGMYLHDEYFNMRAIKIILKNAECNTNGLPALGAECAPQKVFSVKMEWGSTGISYTALSSTAVVVEMNGQAGADSVPVQTQVKQNWQSSQAGGSWTPPHIAYGTWESMTDITVSLSNDTSTNSAPVLTAGTTFHAAVYWDCSNTTTTCSQSFYLVDGSEHPFNTIGVDSYCGYVAGSNGSPGTVNSNCLLYGYWDQTANNNMGDWVEKATYKLNSDGSAFGTIQLDGSGTEDVNFNDDVVFYMVASGPVVNHASLCSFEPFYIDTNANGKLDCAADDLSTAEGDISFSNDWEASNYVGKNPTVQFKLNDNGYSFKDPAGAKKLMNTAFPGWFDGTHTIDANTEFDSLQGLALIYLYFEEGGGGGGGHIEDATAPADAKFNTFMPKMDGGGGGPADLIWFNNAFGAGLTTFKRN